MIMENQYKPLVDNQTSKGHTASPNLVWFEIEVPTVYEKKSQICEMADVWFFKEI